MHQFCSTMLCAFLKICSGFQGFSFDTNQSRYVHILFKFKSSKPRIIVIFMWKFSYYGQTRTCGKITNKLCKQFGIIEYGPLRKILEV